MRKDTFLSLYSGHTFEDWHTECSDDFKKFARGFKSYLKRNLPVNSEIVKHACGHYWLSGFVRLGKQYIYYSYSWDRYSPVKVAGSTNIMDNVLIRFASGPSDSTGGPNMYASIEELPWRIVKLFQSRS